MWSFPPRDLLFSPWTHVSLISQLLLAVQSAAAIVGVVPALRRRLEGIPWFVGLLVGPPLLWILLEASLGLLLSFDSMYHPSLNHFYGWLLRLCIIIGATVLLQSILALQYVQDPLRPFPVLGVVAALLAILGDAVFILSVVTPGVGGPPN